MVVVGFSKHFHVKHLEDETAFVGEMCFTKQISSIAKVVKRVSDKSYCKTIYSSLGFLLSLLRSLNSNNLITRLESTSAIFKAFQSIYDEVSSQQGTVAHFISRSDRFQSGSISTLKLGTGSNKVNS